MYGVKEWMTSWLNERRSEFLSRWSEDRECEFLCDGGEESSYRTLHLNIINVRINCLIHRARRRRRIMRALLLNASVASHLLPLFFLITEITIRVQICCYFLISLSLSRHTEHSLHSRHSFLFSFLSSCYCFAISFSPSYICLHLFSSVSLFTMFFLSPSYLSSTTLSSQNFPLPVCLAG